MHWLSIISGLSSKAGPAWEIHRGISTSTHLERDKTVHYSLSGALSRHHLPIVDNWNSQSYPAAVLGATMFPIHTSVRCHTPG